MPSLKNQISRFKIEKASVFVGASKPHSLLEGSLALMQTRAKIASSGNCSTHWVEILYIDSNQVNLRFLVSKRLQSSSSESKVRVTLGSVLMNHHVRHHYILAHAPVNTNLHTIYTMYWLGRLVHVCNPLCYFLLSIARSAFSRFKTVKFPPFSFDCIQPTNSTRSSISHQSGQLNSNLRLNRR